MHPIKLPPRVTSPAPLARLERHELAISQMRRALHKDISDLYLRAYSEPRDEQERKLLDQLEEIERDVSTQRRRLHRRIDEVREKLGMPSWHNRYQELVA